MVSSRLCLAVLCTLLLGAAACGRNRNAFSEQQSLQLRPAASGLPDLSTLPRASSDDEGNGAQFLIRQDGADFAADLAVHGVTASTGSADFAPQWSADQPNAAGSAAFALYRLTFDPQQAPIRLSLNWNDPAPAPGDCWIGLSDWSSNTWSWQQVAGSELELSSPERYLDAGQHCYVALLMLGNAPCKLGAVGFGTPPPPTGDGYTLFAPLQHTKTYLIDMDGNVVHDWESAYTAGATAELLPSGHLLRAGNVNNALFPAGGRAGLLEEYDWDGQLVWSYELSTATQCTHHDFTHLPNGNVLALVSNIVAPPDAVAAGRNPSFVDNDKFIVDSIIEIQPTYPTGGTIVWEWKLMDHLIQDFDNAQGNFGDPGLHPELADINYPPARNAGDWTHANAVAYNPQLDQVMLTVLSFSEIWIIDHSTTTAEAAGHSGGQCGHGGDILYRWGNPQAYRGGSMADQQFFGCHNGHWIEPGLEGAGDILVFRNKTNNLMQSSAAQFTPPVNPDGTYGLTGSSYGPTGVNWSYQADPPSSMFSGAMGSVQRLPGGETLIDSATQGDFYVIDAAGSVKWHYHNALPTPPTSAAFRALRYLPDYSGLAELLPPS